MIIRKNCSLFSISAHGNSTDSYNKLLSYNILTENQFVLFPSFPVIYIDFCNCFIPKIALQLLMHSCSSVLASVHPLIGGESDRKDNPDADI